MNLHAQRWRVLLGLLVALKLATALANAQQSTSTSKAPSETSAPASAPVLELGKPIEREIRGGETHAYRLQLNTGQFVHVVVEQRGIDLVLTLVGPDGQPVAVRDWCNPPGGEPLRVIAKSEGEYQLRVAPNSPKAPPGSYRVTLSELRAPTAQDAARVTAEADYQEAFALANQANAESIAQAISKWKAALAVWQAGGDQAEEAQTLILLGMASSTVGQQTAALDYYAKALPLLRAIGDRLGEAATLSRIASAYFALGERAKALESFLQALPLNRELGEVVAEVNTLANIGGVYDHLGNRRKAIEYYAQALQRGRETGYRSGEALMLNNIGQAYSGLDEKTKALEHYNPALELWRAAGDKAGEADTLNNIGSAYAALGEMAKALEHYGLALPIYRALGNRVGEATTVHNLGTVYTEQGEKAKALEYFGMALSIYRAVGNRAREATTLNSIGVVYSDLGEKAKALEYYGQALPIHRAGGNRVGEANTLNSIGVAYSDLGEKAKALEYYGLALPIRRAVGDRSGEATTLNNIAAAYSELGEKAKALEYLGLSLPIRRAVGDRAGEATTLNNLAKVYSDLGEKAKALEYYGLALPLYRAVGDRSGEATTLNNIGSAYVDLGVNAKALEYFNQALPIYRAVGNRSGEAAVLNNIGWIYSDLGDKAKALEYYGLVLPIHRAVGNRAGEAVVLNNIGSIHAALGDKAKALEHYGLALPLYRAVGNREGEATALSNLGSVYSALGETAKALSHFSSALVLRRQVKDLEGEGATLTSLMLYWKDQKQPGLAAFYGKQAINSYQKIRQNIQSLEKETQQAFLASKQQSYRELAGLLIAQGRLGEAQEVLDLLKQAEYLDFIRRSGPEVDALSKSVPFTASETELDKRYREFGAQLAAAGEEWAALYAKQTRTPQEEQRLADLKTKLEAADAAFQKYLDELRTTLGDAKVKPLESEEASGLQAVLRELEPGTVAVYTLVGEEKPQLIVVTGQTLVPREYPIRAADLRAKVFEFQRVLRSPGNDPLPLAQEMYRMVLGPVAKDLEGAGAKTVMWSLDDVLRYIPVAALHDGKQYLVEKYRNVVFTPPSLTRMKDRPEVKNWRGLGMGVSKAFGGMSPLPAVPGELSGIIRDEAAVGASFSSPVSGAAGVLPGRVMLDEAFNEQEMKRALQQRYPLVHIASHFVFQPGNELNSYLLLGEAVPQGKQLTLAQIRTDRAISFQGIELLTLSGCNTATGGKSDGKEVDGLGILAQQKGAKAVMASLWEVSDDSTGLLMREFYREWTTSAGVPKVEALRRAQLLLLRGGQSAGSASGASATSRGVRTAPVEAKGNPQAPYSHPYYWAPFILIGNWQ